MRYGGKCVGKRFTGLPPEIEENCTLLILGSFPSVKSLEMIQYYANPNNHFWEIIENVFHIPINLPYDERVTALNKKNIGLWDVIESCERAGSSDHSIKNEKPNDFIDLFKTYPKIKLIIFNGAKAEKAWKRGFANKSRNHIPLFHHIHFIRLPSTSPRNTNKKEKLLIWGKLKSLLNGGND